MDKEVFKKRLNFEVIANLFFEISAERYPTEDKILQSVSKIVDPLTQDPHERVNIKISVVNAIRNMIREVSPTRLYRSLQHRDDLLTALLNTSETLENELEVIQEEMQEES
jgi:type III secretion protein W